MPLVSVIIPTFRRPALLRAGLPSLDFQEGMSVVKTCALNRWLLTAACLPVPGSPGLRLHTLPL